MSNPNIVATVYTYLGGQFELGNGASPEVFTAITQVDAVDYSGSKREMQKVTNADNSDGADRFVGTLKDWGSVGVDIFWNPADTTHQSLLTADDGSSHNFKEVLGSLTRTFVGIVESLTFKETIDKPTKASLKIKVNGPITHTP